MVMNCGNMGNYPKCGCPLQPHPRPSSCSRTRATMNFAEYRGNPLNRIILLLVVLSMGFLLVILAGINGNWMPIVNGILFGLSPLPSLILRGRVGDHDFSFDPTTLSNFNAIKEFAEFTLGVLITSSLAMPLVLYHSGLLTKTLMWLTEIGGGLIYLTVYTFGYYFDEPEGADDVI